LLQEETEQSFIVPQNKIKDNPSKKPPQTTLSQMLSGFSVRSFLLSCKDCGSSNRFTGNPTPNVSGSSWWNCNKAAGDMDFIRINKESWWLGCE
jgi:hypothetical protein